MEQKEQVSKQCTELEAEVKTLKVEMVASQDELKNSQRDFNESQKREMQLSEEVTRLESKHASNVNALGIESQRQRDQTAEESKKYEHAQAQLDEIRRKYWEVDSENTRLSTELEHKNKMVVSVYNKQQTKVDYVKSKNGNLRKECTKLLSQNDGLEKEINDIATENEQFQRDIQILHQRETAEEELLQLRESLENQRADFQRDLDDRQQAVINAEENLRRNLEEHEQQQQDAIDWKEKLQEKESEIDYWIIMALLIGGGILAVVGLTIFVLARRSYEQMSEDLMHQLDRQSEIMRPYEPMPVIPSAHANRLGVHEHPAVRDVFGMKEP